MTQLTSGMFSLSLLGGPSISDAQGMPVPGLASGKPLALLAFLAVRGNVRRDELIELLWGGVPEANARNAFRQALHRLRTGLGEAMLDSNRERVVLAGRDRIVIDRDEFLGLLDAGRAEPALALYNGDFLDGLEFGEPAFDEWAQSERTRLRGRYTSALAQATQSAMEAGRWVDALMLARRLTTALPYDEGSALTEASVLVSAGRRHEAVATLNGYTQRLKTDLDLAAPAAISAMLARLARSDTASARADGGGKPAAAQPAAFVGREQELASLVAAYRDLSSERGSTILLDGEPGIGKSRLVQEFLSRARSLGRLLVLHGRERVGGAAIPYGGIAEALRGTLRAPGLGGASQHLLAEAARILPELRDAFELPAAGPVDDDAARLRFFEGVAALLEAVAYEQPVCLVLDDLHHGSSSTLDLVSYLSARLQGSPVLILIVFRSDALPRSYAARLGLDTPDGPGGSRHAHHLHLGPLDDAHVRELAAPVIPLGAAELEMDRVVALASGNPLRALDAAKRSAAGELGSALPLPIHDLLSARLEAAPPSRRRVFFAAALLPQPAPVRLLAAAAHLTESATLDAAAALERDGLLVPDGDGYALAHDSTTHMVLDLSGAAGRALFAGWAADALASEPDARHADLAYLYGLAGQTQRAFSHARLGGFEALACGAAPEATRLFGLALTFAPNEAARHEIETAMASRADGAGRRRLGAGEASGAAGDQTSLFEDSSAPAGHGATVGSAAPHGSAAAPERTAPSGGTSTAARPRRSIRPSVMIAGLLTLVVAGGVLLRNGTLPFQFTAPADSLLVVERGHQRDSTAQIARTHRDAPAFAGTARRNVGPAWVGALALPWINAMPAPDGQHVSVERMTRTGTDLYVMDATQRDTVLVAAGVGDNVALGWAPDGSALLVSRPRVLAGGGYDTDLYEYRLADLKLPLPIDTSAQDAVTEAAWSPDGSRIAWAARLGATHQQDIFISRADGSNARNITHNPADDDHPSWSPDGTLLAFTSDRNGNADLYAYDLSELRFWRLTFSPAQDDNAVFSPDSRRVAFESTRDGDAAVYVMPALGGGEDARRVTPVGGQYDVYAWRGRGPGYLDRVRILGTSTAGIGDTVSLALTMLDQRGAARPVPGVEWDLLDSAQVAALIPSADSSDYSRRLVARRDGAVQVVARVAGWRADTLTVLLGSAASASFNDGFGAAGVDTRKWLPLGDPAPHVGSVPGALKPAPGSAGHVLFPNGDLQWESGVLARQPVLVRAGLHAEARIYAPFGQQIMQPASLEFSMVTPPDLRAMDPTAPRLTPIISIIWDGESGRVTYAVNGESFTERSAFDGTSHLFAFTLDASGRVSFTVDGALRWRSTTRATVDGGGGTSAQLWIGGRGTGSRVAVGDVLLREPALR